MGNLKVKFLIAGNTPLIKGQLKKWERNPPRYLKFAAPSMLWSPLIENGWS